MKHQVATHNEIILIGRIRYSGRRVQVANKEMLNFVISVPNDEDYNLEPNNISVNLETNNFKMFRGKVGMPIAISGHIDAKWGQRIICDLIKFI